MKILISEKLSQHKFKTSEGYLICTDAILARTGKQEYRKCELYNCDSMDVVLVDRPEKEVFSKETLASFENKPITVEHPNENVTADNCRDYSVGFVRDVHRGIAEGQDVILGTLVITDAKTIEEIENGEHTDLSCGYECELIGDETTGISQTKIRGNHVALCNEGRAGIAKIVDSKMNDSYLSEAIGRCSKTEEEAKRQRESDIQLLKNIERRYNVEVQITYDKIAEVNYTKHAKYASYLIIKIEGNRDVLEKIRNDSDFRKFVGSRPSPVNDMAYGNQPQVKDLDSGFAIVLNSRWKKYGVNSGCERTMKSLNQARIERDSLIRNDGLDFVIIDCSTKKRINDTILNTKDSKIEKVAPELLLNSNDWFDDKAYIERKYDVKISNITSNQGLTITGSKENLEKLSKDFNIKQQIVDSRIQDRSLEEGKAYTTKSGDILTVNKIDAGYSDYNGAPTITIYYSYQTKDGKKGTSTCSTHDFFNMMRGRIDDSRIEDSMYTYKLSKKKNEWDEYVIRAYKDGKKYEDADYYTDDWQDALDTLKAMAKQYNLNCRQQGTTYVADSSTYTEVKKNLEKEINDVSFDEIKKWIDTHSNGRKYKVTSTEEGIKIESLDGEKEGIIRDFESTSNIENLGVDVYKHPTTHKSHIVRMNEFMKDCEENKMKDKAMKDKADYEFGREMVQLLKENGIDASYGTRDDEYTVLTITLEDYEDGYQANRLLNDYVKRYPQFKIRWYESDGEFDLQFKNPRTRDSKLTIEKAKKLIDAFKAIKQSRVKDERLSPMTYKKLRELGYNERQWKNLTQEQANKIIEQKSKKSESKKSKKKILELKQK